MVDYDELNRRIDASGYNRGALAQKLGLSAGNVTINKTPKVTGKGQVYFINRFLAEAAHPQPNAAEM